MINENPVITRLFLALVLAIPMYIAFQTTEAPADQGPKQTICHYPPGNPDNFQEITVSENAVPAHLEHGDREGPCQICPGPVPPAECPCEFSLIQPTTTCWDKDFYDTQDYELIFGTGAGNDIGRLTAVRVDAEDGVRITTVEVTAETTQTSCTQDDRCGTCTIGTTCFGGSCADVPSTDCPNEPTTTMITLNLVETTSCLKRFVQYTQDAIANGVLPH